MSAVQISLYLVAIALCMFSTALTTRGAAGRPLRYFTAFFPLQSFAFLCELWMAHASPPHKAAALALLMASAPLLAPCLWLAVQEGVTGRAPQLAALSRRHWAPIVAGALCTVPLLISAHAGVTYANPVAPTGWLYSRFIHTTMLLCIAVFVAQVPWYL